MSLAGLGADKPRDAHHAAGRAPAQSPPDLPLDLPLISHDAQLPLTFALRPFDFDTLSVRVYQYASDERLAEALLPALMILALGLVAAMALVPSLDQASRRA